jgi:hypothetical protein
MSLLYAALLASVAFVLLIEVVANVRRTSRPVDWSAEHRPIRTRMGVERRVNTLPFVGQDGRRSAGVTEPPVPAAPAAEPERRAA